MSCVFCSFFTKDGKGRALLTLPWLPHSSRDFAGADISVRMLFIFQDHFCCVHRIGLAVEGQKWYF